MKKVVVVLVILVATLATSIFAQNVPNKNFGGIGIIKSYQSSGILITKDMGDYFAGQLIISLKGDIKKIEFRPSYSWLENTCWVPYVHLNFNVSRYSTGRIVRGLENEFEKITWELNGSPEIEQSYGIGIGGGLIYNPQNENENLLPIWFFLAPQYLFNLNKYGAGKKLYYNPFPLTIEGGIVCSF